MTDINAVIARRDRFVPPLRFWARSSPVPSHVSDDLNASPKLTEAELRERMSGNICRCGAYSNIVDAITEVAGSPA